MKPPLRHDPVRRAALAVLYRVDAAQRRLDERREAAVKRARADGCTWAEIGRGLHVSQQAATKRFGHLDGSV